MSAAVDPDEEIEVSADGVTVNKAFAPEEFPVPVIRFRIESTRDEPISIQLTEEIPSAFPMDAVGFHPDYHSDDWTAYSDNHVEFTTTLEPREELLTVYGIRIEDEDDATQFLTEPTIAEVSTDESDPEDGGGDNVDAVADLDDEAADGDRFDEQDPMDEDGDEDTFDDEDADLLDDDEVAEAVADTMIDDIVDEDRSQVVKDVLAGEEATLPGLEPDDEDADIESLKAAALDLDDDSEAEAAADETDSGDGDGDTDDVSAVDLEFGESDIPDPADGDEDTDDEAATEGDVPTEDDPADDVGEAVDADEDAGDGSNGLPASADFATASGSIGSQLAAEIREGNLDDEDLSVVAAALGSASGPQIAKIEHLQSRVEEVAAYSSAMEEYLEVHGAGDSFTAELTTVRSEVEQFDDRLESLETGNETIRSDVEAVESRIELVDEDLISVSESVDELEDTLQDELATVHEAVESVDDDLDSVAAVVEGVEADVEELGDDVEAVESGFADVESTVDDLEAEFESVRADVTELTEWRSQLGSMFNG